jgi:hypothetical protein
MTALEHEIAHGYKLLAGEVLVHPGASPPVTADDQDPDFFRAFIRRDAWHRSGGAAAWRNYVLNDGPVPLRRDDQ